MEVQRQTKQMGIITTKLSSNSFESQGQIHLESVTFETSRENIATSLPPLPW